jgi:hypothetical protein
MQIELRFRHKWMRKEFNKEAGKLSYVYGRDVLVNAIREFCWKKIIHDDIVKERAAEESVGQGTN